MTIAGMCVFTFWVFTHDDLLPGLSSVAYHAMVSAAAWIFALAGTVFINRFHRRAAMLAERAVRDDTVIQLAGGVAHELNQPLTIIITTSELLARHSREGKDIQPYIAQLIQAAERMTDIVQKLERATGYRSKPYVGGVRIVDIDRTSE